ncbi:MAG: UDP-N-acetylglucosamine pyrophosphorylase [Clostridia bacterium]|nr:UDP-N-acetylglucosamine pyrophosphorylase [Clostridia bacterium]
MPLNKKVKTSELFCCENEFLKPLFENSVYPWDMLPKIKKHIEKSDKSRFTEIQEGVFVGENVKIAKTAEIIPPTVIDDGTELRPGAYIRGGVIIGKNCVIGNSSELKNCILSDGAQAPHYNYIGDSVLGAHSHMGAGAVCSNLKGDGKAVVIHGETEIETGLRKVGAFLGDGADVGCGCVLNPGTVVGKNTRVYPLNALRGVFPENSIVKSNNNVVDKI